MVKDILTLTFTPPADQEEEEFAFLFRQVRLLWESHGGGVLTRMVYEGLHSTIDVNLTVGKLKNKIMQYPELNRYVAYKRRLFRASVIRFILEYY